MGAEVVPNEVTVWEDGKPFMPENLFKEQDIFFGAGDRVHVYILGCAGYDNPLARDPDSVLADLHMERYTVDQTQAMFGVILSVLFMAIDAS